MLGRKLKLRREAQCKRFREEPLRTINAMTNHERNLWARAGYKIRDLDKFGRAARNRLERKEQLNGS